MNLWALVHRVLFFVLLLASSNLGTWVWRSVRSLTAGWNPRAGRLGPCRCAKHDSGMTAVPPAIVYCPSSPALALNQLLTLLNLFESAFPPAAGCAAAGAAPPAADVAGGFAPTEGGLLLAAVRSGDPHAFQQALYSTNGGKEAWPCWEASMTVIPQPCITLPCCAARSVLAGRCRSLSTQVTQL